MMPLTHFQEVKATTCVHSHLEWFLSFINRDAVYIGVILPISSVAVLL